MSGCRRSATTSTPQRRGGPNAALSADLRLIAYVVRDKAGDVIALDKIGERWLISKFDPV